MTEDSYDEVEARNREAAEHVRRLRELIERERAEIERLRGSIAENQEHIELTERFLRGDF
jgi:hypothetical protein